MYQWFRTSFRANHTPIFVRVVSDSDVAYIANWKTWQSELCLKGTRELGSRSKVSVNGQGSSASGKRN